MNTQIDLKDLNLSDEELFAPITHDNSESEKITAPRYSYWHSVFRVFFKNKLNIVILSILAVLLLFTYIYPRVIGYNAEYDPFVYINTAEAKHLTPAKAFDYFGAQLKYILGTGSSGDSTFDSIWYGASISISLAFIATLINMLIGVVFGAIWGFSKRFDMFMIQVYNVIVNVPMLLWMSVLVLVLTASFWTMVLALCLTGWIGIAYFIRNQVIIIRDREYNMASKCLGTSTFKIALHNILPFMTSVIVTLAAAEIPAYIGTEVFLSYIGIGLKDRSLGKLIDSAKIAMVTPGWEFEFWSPVVLVGIISIVLYLVGQNLGDAADPRTHM